LFCPEPINNAGEILGVIIKMAAFPEQMRQAPELSRMGGSNVYRQSKGGKNAQNIEYFAIKFLYHAYRATMSYPVDFVE